MQQQDRIKSGDLVSAILSASPCQISTKLSPCIFSPNRFFIWLQAIMTLAADVNPDTTGIDINSTKNPKRRIPRNIVTQPDRKQSKAAYSGIPLKDYKRKHMVNAIYNILCHAICIDHHTRPSYWLWFPIRNRLRKTSLTIQSFSIISS